MQRYKRLLATVLLGIIVCMIGSPAMYASVQATREGASENDAIYVAGNPDAYPIEYYNKKSEQYEGIIPSFLKEISKKTGLNFVYIKAGSNDEREQLARNKQVEIVSGCTGKEVWLKEAGVKPGQTILSIHDEKNNPIKASLAYTSICTPEVQKKIETASKEITQNHLAEITMNVMNAHSEGTSYVWVVILGGCCVALLIGLGVVIKQFGNYKQASEERNQIDTRTGLYRKSYFYNFYDENVPDLYRNLYAMIYIAFDIAHVDEYYSDEVAAECLSLAADEIKHSIHAQEVAARVNAGGFGILHFCSNEQEAKEYTEDLLKRLNAYHQTDVIISQDRRAMFYAGIYMLEPSDNDCEKALLKAQKGYFKAAQTEVASVVTSKNVLMQEVKAQALKHEMMTALANGEFKMYLQFWVRSENGTICGAEAFSRWEHPTRGLLHPGSYISLLESQGSLPALDFFIFEEVCRTLERWSAQGQVIPLSCNIARMTIEQRDFVSRIDAIASKYLFDRHLLCIEISESAVAYNRTHVFENITKCKNLGFNITLDNVGRGSTDFSDFRCEAISMVRLERNLLNAAVTPRGEGLLRGLIEMVHHLGIPVLCEGAETKQQYELLKEMGCDYIQGYYFYYPLPKEEAESVWKKL